MMSTIAGLEFLTDFQAQKLADQLKQKSWAKYLHLEQSASLCV